MREVRPRLAIGGAITALVLALAAPLGAPAAAADNSSATPSAGSTQAAFAAAGRESGVPASLLLALSYALTRWESHAGQPSTAGGWGPIHLVDPASADGRGDPSRVPTRRSSPLSQSAALIHTSPSAVRTDARSNIRAGAALLASYARALGGGRLPSATGGWYAAVARYSGATDQLVSQEFADDVYSTLRAGAAASTSDGQRLRLAAQPGVQPDRSGIAALHLRATRTMSSAECPSGLDCRYIPAAYAQNNPNDPGDYGNYDTAERPAQMKISYIVIHDTEVAYDPTIALFQNPKAYVSAHYVLRSSDGQVTQMVPTKDVAWHAGNWYINMHSIGIEHEGYAAQGAAWYTEALYRSSARLVRYLAARFNIPLDRAHIIGHDNVPGTVPSNVARMHWDPGPFWDWAHYMALLGAPLKASKGGHADAVTIAPNFATNIQPVTGCGSDPPSPNEPVSFVYLRTAPSQSAPLLSDAALHPDGSPGTTQICDTGDKAATGQRFAVAERQGGWTAIWYGGQEAWFNDDHATLPTRAVTVTPRAGLTSIPVYGRAYPEPTAYDGTGIPVQTVTPLQYSIAAGQSYVAADLPRSDYYRSSTYDGSSPGDHTVVIGQDRYVLIEFGHRVAFVKLSDVTIG
ncbi:MAG: peptidoglycan recognition family protein [Mycobacteriales bacterium]